VQARASPDEGTSQVDSRATPAGARRLPRLARSVLAAGTAGALVLAGLLTSPATATPSARVGSGLSATVASHPHGWPGHPGRRIVVYRVKRGDSATGLAVRFHAWTAELLALNHLGPRSRLLVGERIRIPVVVAAARRAHPHRPHRVRHHRSRHPAAHHTRHHARHHTRHKTRHPATHSPGHRARPPRPKPWRQADVSRQQVRRVIVHTARRHRVDPHLALAISWQESGWQQRRRSSAGAIGAMQVLPSTARWMSLYVDRPLNVYGLPDNVTAGVVLIKVLRGHTSRRGTVAAYYQGLGALQKRGVYPSTRRYLRNVLALYRLLRRGWDPL
jgi:LysM repeat protein